MPSLTDRLSSVATVVGPNVELYTLLSRVLMLFAIEFDEVSPVSLVISANVLRLVDEGGVPVHDLPRRSGISRAGIDMALGDLVRRGLATVERTPEATFKAVRLTPEGADARDTYKKQLRMVESSWKRRFGPDTVNELRDVLEAMVGHQDSADSPMRQAIRPYPEGWRAKVKVADTLPHYPMVLHRGGYPDGA
jgi:DNA-binding MarR family transcriptional regulator